MSNVAYTGRMVSWTAVSVLAVLAVLAVPGDADACGGLFCNARPPDPFAPLPVAQNGENVVFAITKDPAGGAPTIQAHIQILYTGAAAKFSWVVPTDAEPTLSTGTDRLFSALAQVTQPRFQPRYETSGTCINNMTPTGAGGTTASGAAGTGFASTGAAGTGGGGVQVSFQGAVGPFDAAVIKSTDPVALKMWLTDNGYIVSDQASGLIDGYVRDNKFFVALKLLNGVGVSSIQPIVLTFRGVEACVPLKLTAIAANPDMPVLVWVLGSSRVAPRAFYELTIDEMRIDWASNGSNYFGPKGLLSEAANEVGGNAFVTEYAGTSIVARNSVYTNGLINVMALRTAMTPPIYVQMLIQMGLTSDPVMLGLLQKYIPMPDAVKAMNVTPSQFYGNLNVYWMQFAFPPFDLAGLSNAIEASIVKPRIDAQMMIDSHTYLTRLNTFISPEEMTKDPLFFESQNLPDLSNVRTATIRTMCGNMNYMACNAPVRLELADGRMAWLRTGTPGTMCKFLPYDYSGLKSLPAAEGAWEREVTGTGNQVVNNSAKIMAGIDANNRRYPTEAQLFPMPPMTGTGGTGAGGAMGLGGATGAGGAAGATAARDAGADSMGGAGSVGSGGRIGSTGAGGTKGLNGGGSGCGCDLGGATSAPSLLALAGALALVVGRRRRR